MATMVPVYAAVDRVISRHVFMAAFRFCDVRQCWSGRGEDRDEGTLARAPREDLADQGAFRGRRYGSRYGRWKDE
ncbi:MULTISPECIES: hypothetical protein [Rhizobium]|uniref:hypothetical protein n=1 Tax=Rhizobium TaxID=379 RepID=UPI0011466D73|nr:MULTISPECIES: hypothetical protein [Rhizobium]MCS0460324.1 hypothetical protein [Rhizobium favelukesii]UFS85370.1 hypothetical protein LPB79_37690 [Rhizobium sp. T136]